ncbi:MAG: universal stress protein [Gemmatimonadetes bacterium]|nr:universal stress protein [Gemmatimonadota bacterium]
MLRSLLVPLDGSSTGERCLPLATKVAQSSGARLHLAHVRFPSGPELLTSPPFELDGEDFPEGEDVGEGERQPGREAEYLRRWEDRLAGEGASVASTVIEGAPIADELADYAAEVAADLVVMSSRGRGGLARALLGSVSDEVIRRAPAPVLVVHPDRKDKVVGSPGTLGHFLVALDGSPLAEHALDPVRKLAKATDARLTLLHVVSDPTYLGPRVTGLRPDRFEPELEGAADYLKKVGEGLRQEGFEVEEMVVQGDTPAASIAEVADAQDADVIAVATHGFGGVKRAVLGSVTDGLLTKTRRPLMVVRPPAE